MDVQKEREAFDKWANENIAKGRMMNWQEWCWEAWQAAKAQVVPEGFILMPKEIDSFDGPIANALEKGIVRDWPTSEIYAAMIESQEPNQPKQFNLDEFLIMEEKLKSKGGIIKADLDRFIAYAEMVLEKAKALKELK